MEESMNMIETILKQFVIGIQYTHLMYHKIQF